MHTNAHSHSAETRALLAEYQLRLEEACGGPAAREAPHPPPSSSPGSPGSAAGCESCEVVFTASRTAARCERVPPARVCVDCAWRVEVMAAGHGVGEVGEQVLYICRICCECRMCCVCCGCCGCCCCCCSRRALLVLCGFGPRVSALAHDVRRRHPLSLAAGNLAAAIDMHAWECSCVITYRSNQ